MSFWKTKEVQGETDEQRKVREEKEQNDFIEKLNGSFEAKLDAKLKPVVEKVTSLDERWTKLETAAGDEGGEGGEGGGDQGLSDEEKRQRADQIEKRKLLALTIATNARITESEVLQEVREKFPEFEAKIKDIYANTSIERKGMADYGLYCRNVMKMVVGEAALAGGLRYDTEKKQFFLENASGGGEGESHEFLAGDMTWTDPTSGKKLTGRDQLAKLGISPEEFAKSVKAGVV